MYSTATSQGVLSFGIRKSDVDNKTIHFGRRFGVKHMLAKLIGKITEEFLEKDKRYEISSMIYARLLLMRSIKLTKRSDWWVRLAIDLKHLRMKSDSYRVC